MNNLNPNTIQDRAANIMKCFGQDINIQKGGVGSGRKIGKTSSGKTIYHYFEHPEHEHFNKKDHEEAAELHKNKSKELTSKEAKNRAWYTKHALQSIHHNDQEFLHNQQAKKIGRGY